MENKKDKKMNSFNTVLYILVLITIVLMFASFYFLYQKKIVEPSNREVIVNRFGMLLTFNKNNQINAHNIKPGWEDSREFSIENYSNDTIGKYNIILEIITPFSNMVDEDFVYTLEGVSESSDTSNKVINVVETPIPVASMNLGTAYITPKNIESYKLVLKLKKGQKKYPSENMLSVRIKIVSAD